MKNLLIICALCCSWHAQALNPEAIKLWQEELLTLNSILELSTCSGNDKVSALSGRDLKAVMNKAAIMASNETLLTLTKIAARKELGKMVVTTVADKEFSRSVKKPEALTIILWIYLMEQHVPILGATSIEIDAQLPDITKDNIKAILLDMLDDLFEPTNQLIFKKLLPEVQTFFATFIFRLAILGLVHKEKEIDDQMSRLKLSNGNSFKEEFIGFDLKKIDLDEFQNKMRVMLEKNKEEVTDQKTDAD